VKTSKITSSSTRTPNVQRARIELELALQWIRDTPKRIPLIPASALLMSAVMVSDVPIHVLGAWLIPVFVSALWRYSVYTRMERYRRARQAQGILLDNEKVHAWLHEAALSGGILGFFSGLSLILAYSYPVSDIARSIVAAITSGTAAAAMLAFYPRAGLAMGFSIVMPFVLWAFAGKITGATNTHAALALASMIYLLVLVVWARGLFANVIATMLLRHENDELVKQLQAAKAHAEQANQEKSRFLAAASHDLRQPMQGLWLFVGNLRSQWGKPESIKILDHIENSLDAMRNLFDSLLNISELDSGGVKPIVTRVQVQSILDRIQAEFSEECDRKPLRFTVRPSSVFVDTDANMLHRVLLNLVSNGLKYTPAGGGIVVACRKRASIGQLHFQVFDTGVGISKLEQESVFNEFVQLNNPERDRNKGLGLGLAIARRLSVLLGGQLLVDSVPKKGSVFTLILPWAAGTAVPPVLPAYVSEMSSISGKLLAFVDDEASIVSGVAALARMWNVRVVAAESETALIAQLTQTNDAPNWVISDYRLRDGKTGLAVIAAVRARWPTHQIAAALLTGDTEANLNEVSRDQAIDVIYKPIPLERLHTWLKASVPT
jgi:two-component system, sensor histidine kinase